MRTLPFDMMAGYGSVQEAKLEQSGVVYSGDFQSSLSPLPEDEKPGPASDPPPPVVRSEKSRKNSRWLSIYITYFTMFLSAVTFSIVISSLWPYLEYIDERNASTNFLGLVVAIYSVGQLIAAPLFGVWSNLWSTRQPLVVSLLINIVFSVLYSYAGAFRDGIGGWVLVVSRFFVGLGAGNAAVVRSYVSGATSQEERTGAMAGVSASQALGFILGPAFGLAFSPLGKAGLSISRIHFSLNMYTGPGYAGALLGLANLLLLVLFKEHRLDHAHAHATSRPAVEPTDTKLGKVKPPSHDNKDFSTELSVSSCVTQRFDRLAAALLISLFFSILFVFAVFETILTPLTMDAFAWTHQQAILYNNLAFGVSAIIAIVTFAGIKFASKKVDERVLMMGGLLLTSFAFFVLVPMGSRYPELSYGPRSGNATGCLYPQQQWCATQPAVAFPQYVVSLLLLSIGYPTASVLCYSIFSKVLGPFPQGFMMGLLTAAGSLARAMGPFFVTLLYGHLGPLGTFPVVDGLVAISVLVMLCSCHRLVPFSSAAG